MARVKKLFKDYIFLSGVILLLSCLFISLLLPKNQIWQTKEAILKNPTQTENYLQLADQLIDNRQFKAADKIIQVLGESDVNTKALRQKKANLDPEEIQKQINYWKKILVDKPDYRDGYLQLAKLYWQIYDEEAARDNLQKALELDPNYPPALELQNLTKLF